MISVPYRVCLGVLVITFSLSCQHYLRQDADTLRQDVLEMLPDGCTLEEAKRVFDDRGYQLDPMREDLAYWDFDRKVHVGHSHFEVTLGHYRGFPWRVWVSATVVFDEDGRLLDVFISREEDSL